MASPTPKGGRNLYPGSQSGPGGSRVNAHQGSNLGTLQFRDKQRIFFHAIPSPEEGRRDEASNKPQKPQLFHPSIPIQDGRDARDMLKKGDWMTKVDLKDAYFMIPVQKVDRRYHHPGSSVSIQLPTIRSILRPMGLYQRPVITLLRELGIRLVVYIDDILIMAETETLAREHTQALIYLLECLGFIVHPVKTIREPSQEIEFLGMKILPQSQELQLPGEKIKKLRSEASKLLKSVTTPSSREVSRLLGKMNAVSQAIPPGPLFSRMLQRDLARALERANQSYESPCLLSQAAKEELVWWVEHLSEWNGKSLVRRDPDIVIVSDASLMGWGAHSNGIRTGGPWSTEEKEHHINCLELIAASMAVTTFLKDSENKTAVAYINSLQSSGNTNCQGALDVVLQERNFPVSTTPAGEGEYHSRCRVKGDERSFRWRLNRKVFDRIAQRFPNLEIDLFASRLSCQLRRFFRRPDPLAEATDAFQQSWTGMLGYANPPWNLIGRVLATVESQGAEIVLVTPIWPSQSWYPGF